MSAYSILILQFMKYFISERVKSTIAAKIESIGTLRNEPDDGGVQFIAQFVSIHNFPMSAESYDHRKHLTHNQFNTEQRKIQV